MVPKPIADFVTAFLEQERPTGNFLDEENVTGLAVAAVRFYGGYAALSSLGGKDETSGINEETEISVSEWAIIKPLFHLYLERETAIHIEASRGMGVDAFGRSTSEIQNDIQALEAELPHRAFSQPIITV